MPLFSRRSYANEWLWKEDGNNDTSIDLYERDSGNNQSIYSCNSCVESNMSQVKPFGIRIKFIIKIECALNTGIVVENGNFIKKRFPIFRYMVLTG